MNPLMFYRFLAWFTVFAMPLATWAKEHTLVTAGNGGATASLTIEMIKEPAVWLEVWDVVGDAEGRVQSVSEDHIGFRDLQHGQINTEYGVPQSPEPWRYFRKQTITSTWSRTFQNHFGSMTLPGWESGRMDAVVARGLDKVDTISGAWSSTQEYDYRTAKYRDMYGGWVYDSPIYRMKVQEEGTASSTWMSFPGYRTIGFGGTRTRDNGQPGQPIETQGINVHAAPYFEGGAGPSYWGPEYMRPGYQGGIKNFGESPPSPWSATEAHFETNNYRLPTDVLTNSFTYSLVLSEEDTLAHVQARIEADLAAIPFASIPWGKEREASAGGTKIKEWTAWGDSLWLYNWESSLVPDGYFYQQEGQVRFNVPAAMRLPEVGYRARFIEYFSPDSGGDQRIVAFHEAELKEGQWESPAFQSTPQTEDGFTILEFFSLAVESINPHPLMTLVTTDTDPTPPEFLGRRPTFEPRDFAGTGYGTRQVINNSATLQQINLIDSWGSLSEWSEEQVKVTWEVLPGATAGVRLWHWKDDGSPNGVWNRLPLDAQLQSYFGSSKDFIFAELTSSGLAGIRITVEIDGKIIFDDVALSSAKLEMAVDANRDGQIKLASEDASDVTSVDRPYRFWINDDDDALIDSSVNIPLFSYTEIEEDDEDVEESGAPDNQNEVIDGKRDLEDLARLRITIGALRSLVHIGEVQDGEIKLGLRWKIASDTPAEGRNPSIRLFISPDATGSNRYLFDEDMAAAQVWQQGVVNFAQAIGVVDADDSAAFVLPDRVFTYAAPDMQLLFEGVEGGRGELQLVILKRNQGDFEEIGQGLSVHLELKRVNELCHRWTCGDGDSTPPEELRFDLGFAHLPSSASSLPAEERDLVLYVHGYNMSEYLKRRWIETTYKRLWHLGYKGRVGGFTWPTAQWAIKFANSEMIAWQSGEKLCALLADLKNRGYRVHMLAHSLGNVVAAEALQLWRQDGHTDRLVDTYIASQAAIPAAVYNPFAETMPDVENVPYSGIPRTTLPPDVYARYWKEGDSPRFPETWTNSNPSYSGKAYIQSTAGRWANFYNRNDYALSGFWEIGNRLKPAKLANFATGQLFNQYEYTAVDGFTKEFGTWIPPHWVKLSFMPLKFPDDRYDIFSYAAPAWSLALGTIPTEGAFTSSTNLAGATYGYGNEHLWHSGQFRSYYAARWRYWNQLLIDAQLKTPD